jgi:predicted nuclease with TOPRIM domain
MDDDITKQIDRLVDEEHRLHTQHTTGEATTDEERERLRELEVQLDQCWDLLRQRRARRTAGRDPDDATVRSAQTVEGYQQ